MVVEVAVRLLGSKRTDAFEAAFAIVVKAALGGTSGDASQGGDAVMAEAVMLQPEDLHVALYAWLRMVIAFVANGLNICLGKSKLSHDRPLIALRPPLQSKLMGTPVVVYCVTLGRVEYTRRPRSSA
jgi:hypothetical protein